MDRRSREASGGAQGRERSPQNLPLSLNSFVGRERELAEVAELVRKSRLVTLTGAPGIGKTRLAVQLAIGEQERYGEGAWLVDLAPVTEPTLVPHAVAAALGVREQRGRGLTEALATHLRELQILVVLDNCEHVIGPCAELVAALVRSCAHLSILATSQEPLAIGGEVTYRVPPLSVPDRSEATIPGTVGSYEAVRLFCDRASATQPGFILDDDIAPAVAEICRRLDGIALAIELAAGRIEMLPVGDIACRLNDRFGLLTGGSRTALPRQQTLRAAVDWSYDLLDGPEQVLLRRLAVFAGGFALDAVEEVCAGEVIEKARVFDLLARLVAKSLVVAEPVSADPRYRLLETIREYGRDRLVEAGEASLLRSRHAEWCVGLVERAEARLTGPFQQTWLERLEADHDNLRAALGWTMAYDQREHALRLASALTLFWRVRGHFSEGCQRLQVVVENSHGAPVPLRAKALWGAGFLAAMMGAYPAAVPVLEESLALFEEAGDRRGSARALLLLGNCSLFIQDRSTGLDLLQCSVELAREVGDNWCLAQALALCGSAHNIQGDVASALPLLEECIAVARAAQDNQCLAFGLNGLGYVRLCRGDLASAEVLLHEAVSVATALGETYEAATALTDLAQVSLGRGEFDQAGQLVADALSLAHETGSPDAIIYGLCVQGSLALARGEPTEARARFQEALDVACGAGGTASPAILGMAEAAHLCGHQDEAWSLSKDALVLDQESGHKARVARGLHLQAVLSRGRGDHAQATALEHQALELRTEIADAPGVVQSLEALAGLAVDAGRLEQAARLFGAAASLRAANALVRNVPETAAYDRDVAALGDSMPPAGLEEAWAQGASLSLREAVSFARKRRGARDRPTTGWASLTRAERDVVALIAEGLTNPEIAERLFISRDTVKGHVARIFAKLGLSSRRDVARATHARERQ